MLAADASAVPTFLSGWVGLVIAAFGLLALLASAAAYYRASYAKATVTVLSETNTALSSQVEALKGEREEDQRQREAERQAWKSEQAKDRARLTALERENSTLKEVVQGKADVERLVMLLQDHHHEVITDRQAFHTEWRGEIDKVTASQDDVLSAVGEAATGLKEVQTALGQVKGMLARRATAPAGERP